MRSKVLLGIVFGVIAAMSGQLSSVRGQEITNTGVFGYSSTTQQWRYLDTGANLGTAWRARTFDDSSWPVSYSAFGFPGNELLPFETGSMFQTILNSNAPPSGPQIVTYYFRTWFNWAGSTNNVILVASNLVDDGAVIYVNGAEAARIAMPGGTISSSTLANRTIEVVDADTFQYIEDVVQFAPTNLVQGTNLIAVELHQGGIPSSDAVFDMALGWHRGTRVAITRQPTNLLDLCAGGVVTNSVLATGSELVYLWYLNNVHQPAQRGPTASFTTATAGSNQIHVIVSNALNSVRSSNTVFTVYPDECGPRLLFAEVQDWDGKTNELELLSDETISSATRFEESNYRIINLTDTNQILVVTNAVGVGVLSQLKANGNFYRSNQYLLVVSGLRDQRGNMIAPNFTIPIVFKTLTNVINFGDFWRYNPSEFDASIGNSWTNLNYNDDPNENFNWGEGQGRFNRDGVPHSGIETCTDLGYPLQVGPKTYYFRKKFLLATNFGPQMEIVLNYVVDDGAVFWLNGNEIHRVRMPNGPISYHTRPSTRGEFGCESETLEVSSNLFRFGPTGTNILAVEVHQSALDPFNDNDNVFDLQMQLGRYTNATVQPGPRHRLTILRTNNLVHISWPTNKPPTNNYILEWTDVINTNLWREAQTNMANPYILPHGYNVVLDPAQDGGGNRRGSGTISVTLSNNVLRVTGSFSGLATTNSSGATNTYTASHIHGPSGPFPASGPVLYNLSPTLGADSRSGTFNQTITLATVNDATPNDYTVAEQISDLNHGLWYINIHSTAFPGGEIRGQIVPRMDGPHRFYRLRRL